MMKHQELCCQYAAEEMQELVRREKAAWFSQVDEDRRARQQFNRARTSYSTDHWSAVNTPWLLDWR
jgi:hypothetical protein